MQLYSVINDWAGRSEGLREALRFFYVCAVPLLATLLAGVLIFAPRQEGAASRRRVAWAALFSIILCLLTLPAVNAFARHFLDAEILSPRPFVTHRVNLLLIEPNDNSFPCPEVMLAAALATLCWAAAPRLGLLGWVWAILLAGDRLACGSNFVADVSVGLLLGGGIAGLCLALCRAHLHFSLRDGRRMIWQPKYQGVYSGVAIALTWIGVLCAFEQTPRFTNKIHGLFGGSASAAPAGEGAPARDSSSSTLASHEGEGMPGPGTSPADTSQDQHRTDFIPKGDRLLRAAWAPLMLPHRILTVDMAQVRAGNTAYRSASVRFIVEGRGTQERARVLDTASRLIRAAYHIDAQLQNIDVVGVVISAQPGDYAPRPVITPGPLPVFSASVSRKDLEGKRQLPAALAKSNPGANEPAAAWLRARSLLYFNEHVLPAPAVAASTKAVIPAHLATKKVAS